MRHNKKFNHLGRTSAHRKAMLSNMCVSLIISPNKRIFTTVAKAKALKKVVEPIITKSKEDTTHSRRLVFQELQSKQAVTELFQNISQKIGDRPGGYTRIIKTGNRLGDNASMCFIELVDFNENMMKETKAAAKPKTRRSRSGKKSETAEVKEEVAVEEPKAKKKAAPKAEKAEEVKEEIVAPAEEATPEAPAAEAAPEEPKTEE